MYGISYDSPTDNKAFADKSDFPFLLLSDEDHTIGETYDAGRPPEDPYASFPRRVSYLIDPDGILRKIYDVTDPGGHAGEVLTDLAAFER